MTKSPPEERINALVIVAPLTPGGPLFVQLKGTAAEPVRFGPYENPDLARGDAEKVRRFLAAVLREAGQVASAD